MIRLIFVILLFAGGYYVVKTLLSLVPSGQCPNCEGRGYWLGTRGDKNTCKDCGGTGRLTD